MNRAITIPQFWIPGKAGLEVSGLTSFEKSCHHPPKKLINALSAGKIDLFTIHCLIDSTTNATPTANNKYISHEKYNFLLNFVAINFSNVFKIRKNTVEFRMSNGQTKYEEILLNMVLYLKLVDTAVKYKKIDPKLFDYITEYLDR